MLTFDYSLESVQLSATDRPAYYLIDLPLNLVRLGGWLTLSRINDKKGRAVPDHRLKNGAH